MGAMASQVPCELTARPKSQGEARVSRGTVAEHQAKNNSRVPESAAARLALSHSET